MNLRPLFCTLHSASRLGVAAAACTVLVACASVAAPAPADPWLSDLSASERVGPVLPQDSENSAGHPGTASPWEVTLGGSGVNNEDFDAGNGQVNFSVGYFLSPNFEISLRQGGSYADGGENVSAQWNGSTRVAADYHFVIDNVLPFLGASFGGLYGDGVTESLAAGPEAGVKVFVQDRAFVYGSAEWLFLFDHDDSLDNAFDDGAFVYNLGFGLRF